LEQLKHKEQPKQEIDFNSMSDEERLQYIIDKQTESKLAPYKQQLEQLAQEKELQEAQQLENEAREYADSVGLDFDSYIPAIQEMDKETGYKLQFKDLLKLVASDDLESLITEKAKSSLLKSLREKKDSTPAESRSGTPVARKMTIEEAYKSAINS